MDRQIIGYVAKMLVGVLDWNLDIQQAIALPNFGSRNGPTEVEKGRISGAVIEALQARGHDVREVDMGSGLHSESSASACRTAGSDGPAAPIHGAKELRSATEAGC